jgi:CBS domain-containing protein
MTRAVTTVTRQTTVRELEALFEKHDFNSFPVVETGKMLGIVTKFDFLRAFAFTTGQMVPQYDDATAGRRNDDRSRCACRASSTIDTSSPVDGER